MICKRILKEFSKVGTRGVILRCPSTIEQSSVEVQYKQEALWRGKKMGNDMSVMEIDRGRGRSWEVNQVVLAIFCAGRGFANSGRDYFGISGLCGVGRSTRLRQSLSQIGWW